MDALPEYISWIGHGAAALPAPATFTGTDAYLFVAEGDRRAMQATVDTLLGPATGRSTYSVPSSYFLVSVTDIERCTSDAGPAVGWLPGREYAVWIPLLRRRAGALPQPILWAPYIFINYTIGMVTGRETWGWPKTLGHIGVPRDDPAANAAFTCRTTVFRTLAPDTEGEPDAALLTIAGTRPMDRPAVRFGDAREGVEELLSRLLGDAVADILNLFPWRPEIPTVVLKQFRDAERQDRACYRAVVESPVTFSNFGGMGLLEDTFTLELLTCESHRILQDLTGRAPEGAATRLPILHALWARFDFSALPGRVLD